MKLSNSNLEEQQTVIDESSNESSEKSATTEESSSEKALHSTKSTYPLQNFPFFPIS
jgi:hypothetical protein